MKKLHRITKKFDLRAEKTQRLNVRMKRRQRIGKLQIVSSKIYNKAKDFGGSQLLAHRGEMSGRDFDMRVAVQRNRQLSQRDRRYKRKTRIVNRIAGITAQELVSRSDLRKKEPVGGRKTYSLAT